MGVKNLESSKSALDPTPKHECHVSKNANRVTSLLAYRAYELTQVGTCIHFSVMTCYLFVTKSFKMSHFQFLLPPQQSRLWFLHSTARLQCLSLLFVQYFQDSSETQSGSSDLKILVRFLSLAYLACRLWPPAWFLFCKISALNTSQFILKAWLLLA